MSILLDTSILVKEITKELEKVIDKKIADNNTFTKDVILTEQELSKELKISSKKLSLMRKKGELPSYTYFYVGKNIRYKKDTVIEYFVTRDKLV
tara:strand:- start:220 stop:501 length:282 start_codon:yes stop_codon:yes gene_type:complete